MIELFNAIVFVVLSCVSIVLFALAYDIWRDADWIREIRYRDRMRAEYWNNVFRKK